MNTTKRSASIRHRFRNLQYVKYRSALERFRAECGSLGVLVFSERRACLLFLSQPTPFATEIMNKNKQSNSASKKKAAKIEEKETSQSEPAPVKVDSLDDEEQGFGGWLRSSDGMETMKLFVIANSIVMLTTLVYPHVRNVFEIISDMIYDTDIPYDD